MILRPKMYLLFDPTFPQTTGCVMNVIVLILDNAVRVLLDGTFLSRVILKLHSIRNPMYLV